MEIVLTFVLMYVVLAVGHERKAPLALVAGGRGGGSGAGVDRGGVDLGASMNPARSFRPATIGWAVAGSLDLLAAPAIGAGAAAFLHRAGRAARSEGLSFQPTPLVIRSRAVWESLGGGGES